MIEKNHHCSIITIGKFGLLIEGASGSGKTSLALGLIDYAAQARMPAELLSDDQALLSTRDNILVARAPKAIKGKVEIRGYGVVDHPTVEKAHLDLIVRMIPDETVQRMPFDKTASIMGVDLPLIEVPQRHEEAARRIIFAWINDRNKAGNK